MSYPRMEAEPPRKKHQTAGSAGSLSLSFGAMRSRATFALTFVAFTQIGLIGFALVFLVIRLRAIDSTLMQRGREEELLLGRIAEEERDLYRTSILLRDDIILEGSAQSRAKQDLIDVLGRISRNSLRGFTGLSPAMEQPLLAVESARAEYLEMAQNVLAWQEPERKMRGADYLAGQLAPMRERFSVTAGQIVGLIQSLRDSRNRALADSVREIEALIIRILTACALLGFSLAGVAVWRFQHYERESEIHVERLVQAENSLRTLSQRLVGSQEYERKRLSRELHDELGQILTALRVQLGQIQPSQDVSRIHLEQASDLADRSLRTVREMARGLRPAMLDDLGLAPALKWLGRDLSRNTVLDIDVGVQGEFLDVPEPLRTCVYRVAQEALTNCVRHSGAARAEVRLTEHAGELLLTVQDSGVGFSGRTQGVGLLGMRERIEELRGDFEVLSSPGQGTLIRARFPMAKMEAR